MDDISITNSHRNRITSALYYGMRVIVAAAAVLYIYDGTWDVAAATLLILVLMSLPTFLKRRYHFYLPFTLEFGVVLFIFLTFFLGHIEDYYDAIPLWDKLLHFQSGLLLSVAGYVLVYLLNETGRKPLNLSPLFVSIFAVVFSIALGALWEIAEFTAVTITGGIWWQGGLVDTMWDLIADSIGAVLVSTVGYIWMRYELRIPFTPRFLRNMK